MCSTEGTPESDVIRYPSCYSGLSPHQKAMRKTMEMDNRGLYVLLFFFSWETSLFLHIGKLVTGQGLRLIGLYG